MAKLCSCTSGRPYAACCAPLHRGQKEAEAPEALMRSRFAAFALGDVEYLWRTLHPEHEERAANKTEFVRAVTATCRALKFMRLTILEARGDRVLFLAGVFEKGRDRSFVELSTFAREGEGGPWRYRSGEARSPVDARQAHQWTIDSFEAGGAGGPGLGVG